MNHNQSGASLILIIVIVAVVIAIAVGAYLVMQGGDDGEQSASENKIVASSQNVTVVIEPASGDAISGTVDVSITEAPDEASLAFFVIEGPGTGDMRETGPNLGIDDDDSDGWSVEFDTTGYENGSYEISGLPTTGPNDDPLGVATAQVTIDN